MSVQDYLDEAKEELKRLDHTVFVSLKYTRTVEVITAAIKRLRSAFELLTYAVLIHLKEKKKIDFIPVSMKEQIAVLREQFVDDQRFLYFLTFYKYLRDLCRAPCTKRQEYRRHVTLIASLDNSTTEVNIDNLEDWFDRLGKEFLDLVEVKLGFKEVD